MPGTTFDECRHCRAFDRFEIIAIPLVKPIGNCAAVGAKLSSMQSRPPHVGKKY
ncbi:MAG: hypothetical protein ACREBR_00050 [bacterium]